MGTRCLCSARWLLRPTYQESETARCCSKSSTCCIWLSTHVRWLLPQAAAHLRNLSEATSLQPSSALSSSNPSTNDIQPLRSNLHFLQRSSLHSFLFCADLLCADLLCTDLLCTLGHSSNLHFKPYLFQFMLHCPHLHCTCCPSPFDLFTATCECECPCCSCSGLFCVVFIVLLLLCGCPNLPWHHCWVWKL